MRELFLDAAEAVWWVVTAPLRKVVADAMQEVLDRQHDSTEQPALKWSDDPEPELPLRMPPARRLAERLGIGW